VFNLRSQCPISFRFKYGCIETGSLAPRVTGQGAWGLGQGELAETGMNVLTRHQPLRHLGGERVMADDELRQQVNTWRDVGLQPRTRTWIGVDQRRQANTWRVVSNRDRGRARGGQKSTSGQRPRGGSADDDGHSSRSGLVDDDGRKPRGSSADGDGRRQTTAQQTVDEPRRKQLRNSTCTCIILSSNFNHVSIHNSQNEERNFQQKLACG